MIELKPFTEEDFETLISWVNSKEELYQFAGSIFDYPLTDDQLKNYIQMEDKKPFKVVLSSTNESIGHCELNFENGNRRISRVLLGRKDLRGMNIGGQIIRNLVELMFENPEKQEVDLNIFDWNKAAINCYQKVGFNFSDTMGLKTCNNCSNSA
ncbi:GNAT family N-acetyltransferase [Aureibacter tunicatorum]|uniref:RimJ/RimL family protein N-acetyltransferase n=1 Tax=Aureibacter tunicatorum TaxID=866807 RepID=A0AAE4BRW9_9BACT|nr:GNAT family protein [Aureibacter tunicatorum]MDR6240609.1 RimJ/RimL family protein N-acetyltransferase [Aureibacter tunicatorum]BDD06530.1 N-acetyltransferase [Aureibacter tunicatorum]